MIWGISAALHEATDIDVHTAAGAVMCVQALAKTFASERLSAFIDVTMVVYRQLRHTAIVQLARAGCSGPPSSPLTVPEIASITGHSIKTVTQILEHYLPRDSVAAQNAIAKLEAWRRRT
jgi:integrase